LHKWFGVRYAPNAHKCLDLIRAEIVESDDFEYGLLRASVQITGVERLNIVCLTVDVVGLSFVCCFGRGRSEWEMPNTQSQVCLRPPCSCSAGNDDMSSVEGGDYMSAQPPDGELKVTGAPQTGFIDGIQKNPALITGGQPLLKRIQISDFKRVIEMIRNVLQSNEKCRFSFRAETQRYVPNFGCFSCPCLGQNDEAILRR
jgi:hypothetical protein